MLLDANLLLYAVDSTCPYHDASRQLVEDLMHGSTRVGLPWQTINAFVRLTTNPRMFANPMTGLEAWGYVEGWLARPVTWISPATETTARVYGELARKVSLTGNLVPDGMLAALAIEHGLEVWSADSDFARFPGLRWRNPLTSA